MKLCPYCETPVEDMSEECCDGKTIQFQAARIAELEAENARLAAAREKYVREGIGRVRKFLRRDPVSASAVHEACDRALAAFNKGGE